LDDIWKIPAASPPMSAHEHRMAIKILQWLPFSAHKQSSPITPTRLDPRKSPKILKYPLDYPAGLVNTEVEASVLMVLKLEIEASGESPWNSPKSFTALSS
jgi:hypothetical protein